MKQNDRRNKKISEICRILANACMSENTSLYPEDIMTFVNESRNSDIKELLALHMTLNEIDATRHLEKEIEKIESWNHFDETNKSLHFVFDDLKRLDEENDTFLYRSMNRMFRKHENEEYQRKQEDNTRLDLEIVSYEALLSLEHEYGLNDNDIAFETAYAIAEENARREHQLSQIACDAVKKHVYYGTVVHFMNEMCKDDKERTFFLQEYSNAQWRDGRYN